MVDQLLGDQRRRKPEHRPGGDGQQRQDTAAPVREEIAEGAADQAPVDLDWAVLLPVGRHRRTDAIARHDTKSTSVGLVAPGTAHQGVS